MFIEGFSSDWVNVREVKSVCWYKDRMRDRPPESNYPYTVSITFINQTSLSRHFATQEEARSKSDEIGKRLAGAYENYMAKVIDHRFERFLSEVEGCDAD